MRKRKKSATYNHARVNLASGQGASRECQGLMSSSMQFEEQKFLLEAEMLDMERQCLRWLWFSELEERDLEKMLEIRGSQISLLCNSRWMVFILEMKSHGLEGALVHVKHVIMDDCTCSLWKKELFEGKNFTTGGYYMEDTLQFFGDMMECQPLSFQEPLGSIQIDRHQAPPLSSYQTVSFNPQKILEAVPSGIGSVQQLDQSVLLLEGDKDFAGNTQCPNGQNRQSENSTEKIEQGWQRIRWTEDMVKVLINAVSYFNEVVSFDGPENERSQMKGKWRSISKTMTERGYVVSPQQCEDKLNDLNKKYKRLNHLLGTDDSFDIVDNPALMEPVNIPEEAKEEVRKILACKQLFYREMHSYHHKNKRFLPHDEGLQKSVVFNIKGRARYCCQDVTSGVSAKRRKHGEDDGASDLVNTHPPENKFVGDLISVGPEAIEEEQKLSEWIKSRSLEVEAKRVQIHEQRLELEEKKFEWLRLCEVEDEQLRKMKLENELMRLENERLAFEVKCWGRCNDSE